MSEWWTYRLSDFLMFSPTTYWRLVERTNRELWPLHLVMVAAGLLLLRLSAARRPAADKVVAAALAGVWLWVGWAFHWQRYAPINWAAEYFATAFWLQAALLFAFAVSGGSGRGTNVGSWLRGVGLALAAAGVLLYPLVAPWADRPWSQVEVFGVMPEPTALATVGFLLAMAQPYRKWLLVIPMLSLLVGLATWWLLREVSG